MELKQSLADAKKEAAENDTYIQHWTAEHDKLHLADIEYVTFHMIQRLSSHSFTATKMKMRKMAKRTRTTRKTMSKLARYPRILRVQLRQSTRSPT